jgi:serine/threonine-protein kinase
MAGDILGHYRILVKLGEGTMGPLYRAHDSKLNREVALKVFHQGFADVAERWRRLAEVSASVNHPNIASVYGVEESEGVRYVVLELLPRVTLAERLRQRPLPLKQALAIAQQVAEAVEAFHKHGIRHRDLQAANIVVIPNGNVKVLLTLKAVPPKTGQVTEAAAFYISPEEIKGDPADKRADIWAFGCLLYEMITGRHPFKGKTFTDLLLAIIETNPDWAALPAATPASICDLLQRCLENVPQKRLRSMGEVRMRLEEALAGRIDS